MKKSGTEEGFRRIIKKLDKKIDGEIAEHKYWCSPRCSTFMPSAYREVRLSGYNARTIQKNHDACHIF